MSLNEMSISIHRQGFNRMTPLPEPGTTVHLLGTLITYRATAAQTDGLFALADVRTAPGAITPPR